MKSDSDAGVYVIPVFIAKSQVKYFDESALTVIFYSTISLGRSYDKTAKRSFDDFA